MAEIDLETDHSFKIGKLDSGFTYYVRKNKKPANRAELKLAVNIGVAFSAAFCSVCIFFVGSVQESDDERGVAHFCEHLQFRRTEKYGEFELIEFLGWYFFNLRRSCKMELFLPRECWCKVRRMSSEDIFNQFASSDHVRNLECLH